MAAEIILFLANGLLGTEALRNKRTRKGKLRLDDCIKFDLGSGYRMVALNKKDKLILLFAGSHDDCDLWLNNRRREKVQIIPHKHHFPTNKPPVNTLQKICTVPPNKNCLATPTKNNSWPSSMTLSCEMPLRASVWSNSFSFRFYPLDLHTRLLL